MAGLETSVTVATDLDTAWRAFTDAADFAAWFWPPAFDTAVEIDARPGGSWSARSLSVGIGVSGVYASVEPRRDLRTSWVWDGEPETTDVTVAFTASDAIATTIAITHTGFATQQARDEHIEGWNDCLARLAERLAPEPHPPAHEAEIV